MKLTRLRLFSVTLVFTGILLGYVIGAGMTSGSAPWHEEREQSNHYQYISPLLSCDGAELSNTSTGELKSLRSTLQSTIDTVRSAGHITRAAVYVRELGDGVWLGINEREEFTPGSLLKVPAVMSLYKYADEKDPAILMREFEFGGGSVQAPQHYPPAQTLVPGTIYSMRDMVQRALRYSDNDAASLIAQSIDADYLFETYTDLGFTAPALGHDYLIRVKDYAAFFRLLYNATYIPRDASEYVLETLSHSMFEKGLAAGVPAGVKIAHKFGERDTGDGLQQLHDCGIVYTQHPYIICVLSQGKDFTQLESFIADISRTTYAALK